MEFTSICPDLRFHISQLIIFHITPAPLPHFTTFGSTEVAFLHTKITLNSNSSQCSPIVALFHSAVPKSEQIYSVLAPKHCKSAHNLAQPSGKGLQTADNWLELELNGVLFATKNSLLSDNVVKCGSGGGVMWKI